MAEEPKEEDQPVEVTLPHRPSAGLRTVYASGAIIAGPIGALDQFVVTFYTDTIEVAGETLLLESAAENGTGRFKGKPEGIRTHPVREDQARVLLSKSTMESLINLFKERLKLTEQVK